MRKFYLMNIFLVISLLLGCSSPKIAPFENQRWQDQQWQVKIDDQWFQLRAINEVPVDDISKQLLAQNFQWRRAISMSFTKTMKGVNIEIDDTITVDVINKQGNTQIKEVTLTNEKYRTSLRNADLYPIKSMGSASLNIAACDHYTEQLKAVGKKIDIENSKFMINKLEGLIDNNYAYRQRTTFNYKQALNCLRQSLNQEMTVEHFYRQMNKILNNFGDGHLRLMTSEDDEPFLPFLVFNTKHGYLALHADRDRALDKAHPYIQQLDGKPISFWIDLSTRFSIKGSPQFNELTRVKGLRYITMLRSEAGLTASDSIDVTLTNKAGDSIITKKMSLIDKSINYSKWPHTETKILANNMGYLRIPKMSKKTDFIDEAMQTFKNTQGLIIDVRGNAGGRRAILKKLMPYFLSNDEFYISNIAKFRITPLDDTPNDEGYLANRYLYPATSSVFNNKEREKLSGFLSDFQPNWQHENKLFSQWHFMVHRAQDNKARYVYQKPVIILMDQMNFSATDIFLNAFKGRKGITLIGQASGGGSSRSQFYILPSAGGGKKWGAVLMASMISYKTNGDLIEGIGVQPDVHMAYTVDDLTSQSDTILDKAISMILEQNK